MAMFGIEMMRAHGEDASPVLIENHASEDRDLPAAIQAARAFLDRLRLECRDLAPDGFIVRDATGEVILYRSW
jgi:hypothetical protein